MEKITATCPNCKTTYTLNRDISGKKVRCKQCSTVFVAQPITSNNTLAPQVEIPSKTEVPSENLLEKQRELVWYFTQLTTKRVKDEETAQKDFEQRKQEIQRQFQQVNREYDIKLAQAGMVSRQRKITVKEKCEQKRHLRMSTNNCRRFCAKALI